MLSKSYIYKKVDHVERLLNPSAVDLPQSVESTEGIYKSRQLETSISTILSFGNIKIQRFSKWLHISNVGLFAPQARNLLYSPLFRPKVTKAGHFIQ